MTNRTGPGRPHAPAYVTSWGESIHGAYKGKDGKLRPIGQAHPKWSLADEPRAVNRYRQWQASQGPPPQPEVKVEVPLPETDDWGTCAVTEEIGTTLRQVRPDRGGYPNTRIETSLVALGTAWKREIRQRILVDPRAAAAEPNSPKSTANSAPTAPPLTTPRSPPSDPNPFRFDESRST